ncbi:CAP domain-containing protein [Nitratifractor sp.]
MGRVTMVLVMLLLALPLSAMDRDGVRMVNSVRKAAGMIPLNNNAQLARAAYHHAKYLGRLRAKGHGERPGRKYFFGRSPFDRFIRAGYSTKVGMENISYGNRSYAESVGVLMSTVYHRLGFLDFRIDEMGSSEYGNRRGRIYVYDMGPSTVARLCRSGGTVRRGEYLYGVCADPKKKLSKRDFSKALASIERRNARIVLYPYPGMKNAPRRYIRETPDPVPKLYGAGVPITAQFNPAYYRRVSLRSFRLFDAAGRELKVKRITPGSDIHHKLPANTFVVVPYKRLQRGKSYRVELEATADGKRVKKEWSFRTGN